MMGSTQADCCCKCGDAAAAARQAGLYDETGAAGLSFDPAAQPQGSLLGKAFVLFEVARLGSPRTDSDKPEPTRIASSRLG